MIKRSSTPKKLTAINVIVLARLKTRLCVHLVFFALLDEVYLVSAPARTFPRPRITLSHSQHTRSRLFTRKMSLHHCHAHITHSRNDGRVSLESHSTFMAVSHTGTPTLTNSCSPHLYLDSLLKRKITN